MKSELSFVGGALLWKVDVSYWDGIHEKLTKIEKGGKDDQFDQKAGGRRLWTSIVDGPFYWAYEWFCLGIYFLEMLHSKSFAIL